MTERPAAGRDYKRPEMVSDDDGACVNALHRVPAPHGSDRHVVRPAGTQRTTVPPRDSREAMHFLHEEGRQTITWWIVTANGAGIAPSTVHRGN